jgi:hypothetical protein
VGARTAAAGAAGAGTAGVAVAVVAAVGERAKTGAGEGVMAGARAVARAGAGEVGDTAIRRRRRRHRQMRRCFRHRSAGGAVPGRRLPRAKRGRGVIENEHSTVVLFRRIESARLYTVPRSPFMYVIRACPIFARVVVLTSQFSRVPQMTVANS